MPAHPHQDNSRRRFFQKVAAGVGAGAAPRVLAAAERTPNIIYMHSHDTGRYLQPYGYGVPTPNLLKLARDGVLFRNAFSAAPTCSPSRAALLTGQCAHSAGMLGLVNRGFGMPDYRKHLLYTLRDAGYQSVLAGLQHIAARPEQIGFDELLRPASNRAADVAPKAVEFLNRKSAKPFFLDVGFFETHREFPQATVDDDPRFIQPPLPIPDTPETRADMAGFHASARVLDRAVGQVLEALERSGQAENTLVISTTDHGLAFPRMKCNLTDAGWGVSLIMRGPGAFRGGKVSDALISHIDLYPTICELLEFEPPAPLEGKSFLPVLRGEKTEVNEEVFAEVNYHAAYEPQRAVRTQRWKYIRRYGDWAGPVLPNCDDGLSKSLWVKGGWRQQNQAKEQLYDLLLDPIEQSNLAGGRGSTAVLKEMRGRMDAWMKRTDDPLLRGPIPLPLGARTNPVDGASPRDPTVEAR